MAMARVWHQQAPTRIALSSRRPSLNVWGKPGKTFWSTGRYIVILVTVILVHSASQFHADRGDVESCYRLGKIYYHGGIYTPSGGVSAGAEGASALPKDFDAAWTYFLKVARKVWTRDNPSKFQQYRKQNVETADLYYAVHAAFYLGRMHLRGEGVRQDIKTARMWFERGAGEGDKESLNALGIIHRDGLLDGKAREDYALVQFGRAAAADLPEALVNMGKIYYRKSCLALLGFRFVLRTLSQSTGTLDLRNNTSRTPFATAPSSKPITGLARCTPTWPVCKQFRKQRLIPGPVQ
jgi:TPR repeat protein